LDKDFFDKRKKYPAGTKSGAPPGRHPASPRRGRFGHAAAAGPAVGAVASLQEGVEAVPEQFLIGVTCRGEGAAG
jgi:hypothetical protein